ncbi:MAG: DegV family protein [Defluviitaleaceae bacterium]|nr:DegV family protein [Defluviitaleaceae bacterium]MCL2189780.1 DegV family protein [Defluviitaleaceae bacterium]MCL2275412.1 DegV family protein [Defluviitaleaceae bacterium]
MSKNFTVIVDSTTDIKPEWATEWGISTVIPFIVTVDGKDYFNELDERDIKTKEFYDLLRAGKSGSTTQITAFRYIEVFEPFLREGQDILYLCLSSGLSKSYEQSLLAVEELQKKYPERRVVSVDSKSASLGEGMLAYHAAQACREGKTLDEAAAYLQTLIPRTFHWIMADDLHHLRRGGRVSGAAAFMGTLLSVKPILTIVDSGRLIPIHKARGHEKAFEYILSRMETHEMPKDQPIFVAHSDAPEAAERLMQKISAKYGECKFFVNNIGPVIGAHTGPGTVAAVFLGNERIKEHA